MKKLLLSIVSLTTLGLMAQLDVTGTWVLKPVANAMAVGPAKGDYSWWGNPADEVAGARACQFDDEFVLSEDGTFKNVFGEETFLEGWQGADGCGAPVAPFDGSANATWTLDETANTLTVYGKGAFIGIPKVINMKEISSVDDAADSITYMVSVNADTMTLEIQINTDGAHWKFDLVRKRVALNPVGTWRLAPKANAMAVGPTKGDYSWWGNPADEVEGARACQFDDDFVFMADGTFKNVFGDETFIEAWQGSEGCGAPVAPFDGSAAAQWSADDKTITVTGKGAFLGIPKVINMKEISTVDDAAESITYMASITEDTMILEIQINDAGAHWMFELVKQADNSMANRAIQVGSLKVYPNPVNDMIFVSRVNAKSIITIRDFSGKVINSINGVNAMGGINVSNLKTGAYLIEMTNNNNVQTAKFIKN